MTFFLRSSPNGQGENPLNFDSSGKEASGQDLFELPTELTDDLNEEVQDGITDPAQPQNEETGEGSGGSYFGYSIGGIGIITGGEGGRLDGGGEGDGWYKFDKDAYN